VQIVVTGAVNALVLSSMYILVALGFALLLSIAGILNFAHGAIYMVGGYICYQFAVGFGLNLWLSLLVSVLIVGLLGLLLEKFCFRAFFGDMVNSIIMSVALIIILETTVNVTVGVYIRSIPQFASGIIRSGAISISAERIVTLIIGGILLLLFTLFIKKAKIGLEMLAISQDPVGAVLQGINIHSICALAFFMGCGLAAVAGCLMGAVFGLSPFMGDFILVKAIQLVILGGIGSTFGILVAGLIIGSIDATLPLFVTGAVTDVVGFGVIVVLLLLRPQGLFGRREP
jgi:branched-chain amino acid transport system permease protein